MKKVLGIFLCFVFASADAALIDRGGGFIYDDVQDITWTQDANINGSNTWANQVAWAANLSLFDSVRNVTWSNWRLPTTTQPDPTCSSQIALVPPQSFAFNCTGSEMGHLFNVDGVTNTTPGLFTNVQANGYRSGTEFAPNPTRAWIFSFYNGVQDSSLKSNNFFSWAVRPGDVSVVPVPAAVWLFGSGLMGLLGLRRVRR